MELRRGLKYPSKNWWRARRIFPKKCWNSRCKIVNFKTVGFLFRSKWIALIYKLNHREVTNTSALLIRLNGLFICCRGNSFGSSRRWNSAEGSVFPEPDRPRPSQRHHNRLNLPPEVRGDTQSSVHWSGQEKLSRWVIDFVLVGWLITETICYTTTLTKYHFKVSVICVIYITLYLQ